MLNVVIDLQVVVPSNHKHINPKDMKKLVLSFALVIGLTYVVSAQTEGAVRKLSIGAEFGLPAQKDADNYMVGGSLQFEQPIAKSLNLTISAGYLSSILTGSAKDYFKSTGVKTTYGTVPLKAGAKYYFGKNFYGAGELGARINTSAGGNTAFVYAPSLGTSFSVGDKSSLDLGLRYETWTKGDSYRFFGLRAAFAFGL